MHFGPKLCDKTLQTLAEYFESICNTRIANGSLHRHLLNKVKADAKRKMRCEFKEHYSRKLGNFAGHRKSNRLRNNARRDDNYPLHCDYDQHNHAKILDGRGSCGNKHGSCKGPHAATTRASSPVPSMANVPTTRGASAARIL